jgi:uncharacterized membrane protein
MREIHGLVHEFLYLPLAENRREVILMNMYLFIAILGLLLPSAGYFSAREKQNSMLGVRLPATYADPEVWRKTNQKFAQIMYLLGPTISIVSILFYLGDMPEDTDGVYFLLGIVAALLIVGAYLYIYSRNLLLKTLAQPDAAALTTMDNIGISRVHVILLLIVAIVFVIVGVLEIYGHAGTSIGVRVGNVFRDAATWHKVNTMSGIGDIIIGVFFAGRFSRFILGVKDVKAFEWEIFSFIAAGILWTIASAIYAYHV